MDTKPTSPARTLPQEVWDITPAHRLSVALLPDTAFLFHKDSACAVSGSLHTHGNQSERMQLCFQLKNFVKNGQ